MKVKLSVSIFVIVVAAAVTALLIRQRSLRSIEALQGFALELLHLEHPDWILERTGNSGIRIQVHGQEGHLYLGNIAREAGSDRTIAKKLIATAAQELSQQPKLIEQDAATPALDTIKPRLRPVLVPHDYAQRFELAGRVFVDDVWEVLVIDSQRTTRYVRTVDLNTWQAEFDSLRTIAENALWKDSQSVQLIAKSPTDPTKSGKFIAIDTRDGYAAARLVLPEIRQALAKQLGEPFFAAVPNRESLVAWSNDYAFADQFATKVRQDFETRSHPISPIVYRVYAARLEAAK